MKVVLFCGGLGMRLYPTTEEYPKPLVPIGEKPVLWNLMKYYSYFGHEDFILCLGYKGEQIKKYFLENSNFLSNDFTLSSGGKKKRLLDTNAVKWNVTFIETGLNSNIGQRLKAVQKYLKNEEMFLANYGDAVTDLSLPKLIDFFKKSGKIGCLVTVKPFYSYHTITASVNGRVKSIRPIFQSKIRLNGGYFVFRNEIFDYIKNGEDLVDEPFHRLIQNQELVAYRYDGFWATLDTFKDKARLDELAANGKACWQIWKN
jgi:glucose-1-phosphate cytidylyltransferase